MPLDEKRRVFLELNQELNEVGKSVSDASEKKFVDGLRRKALLAETPLRRRADEARRAFKRVEVIGEPLSETIVKERG